MSDPPVDSACENCPCGDICLRRPDWCGWMAGPAPDPVHVRAILNRSRIAAGMPPTAGEPARRPEYPPLARRAANLAGAVGRAVAAAARGEPVTVPADVLEARRAICAACEFNGHREQGGIRCMKCGCGGIKLTLATERCPLDPPKWDRIPT